MGQTGTFVGQVPNACIPVGGFYVLYDENEENEELQKQRADDDERGRKKAQKGGGAEWR